MTDLIFPFISVVVEIQKGKTTIVSIIELAIYNLFNTWSCLAAPLREGKREVTNWAPSSRIRSFCDHKSHSLLFFKLFSIVWLIRNSHLYLD